MWEVGGRQEEEWECGTWECGGVTVVWGRREVGDGWDVEGGEVGMGSGSVGGGRWEFC